MLFSLAQVSLFIFVAIASALAGEVVPHSGVNLRPDAGQEMGRVYQAWLSPLQQSGEEEDTPTLIPRAFRSTQPSVPRNARRSRGHGVLAITRDQGHAFAHVKIEGINPDEIIMFHLHCGRPGQLGPILVDFGRSIDLTKAFATGDFFLEITNEDTVAVSNHRHGIIGALTAGCPIIPAIPMDKVRTVAGLAYIADQGDLYFNLHTKGQAYFGEIRGQLSPLY
jgi:hypothetical protein